MDARHLWGEPERECVFRLVHVAVIIRHYSHRYYIVSVLCYSVGMSTQNTISCFLSSIQLALSYSLCQASIASCRSAALRLSCSLRQASCRSAVVRPSCSLRRPSSGKHSFVSLSCPTSVLFSPSGKHRAKAGRSLRLY